ncbi:sensor histidine kinase [Parabacteroides faecis]|uniref:Signal transduction histidine kinase internal region domain-containing protein n=1 Tax=Parabacteroides faecis TaxID=1217282 RepID=A0ABR6KI94_9BACT|nr:histidine kinase [Parabacteroides faecis]MBB4621228.1 hypothetical protein [Parabacteroides faecis]GGJ88276.1 histidine kinase [Parabacteroides faecis]
MEKQERRQKLLENLIYLIIWVVILVSPLLEHKYNGETINWNDIFRAWKMIAPFFILFLINNYVLIPFLLIRKKSWLYLLFSLLTVCLIFALNPFVKLKRPGGMEKHPPREFMMNRPPKEEMPGPKFPMEKEPPRQAMRPPMWQMPGMISPMVNFILTAILVLGLNVAIKLLFKSIRDEHRMKELEKHTLQTELEYLKHQINPHFFMNTLNNIHALIDLDTEKAKETVLELSKMMRYVLYDATQPTLPLAKEIAFLDNYIGLMKLRYTDQVEIGVSLPEEIPNVQIPPLLFISFLENAFKHGISYRRKSFIHLSMKVKENEIECLVINSSFNNATEQHKGIGLENVKKRLRLLYDNDYTLDIQSENNEYRVLLIIPIQS